MPLGEKTLSKARVSFTTSLTRAEIDSFVANAQLKILQTNTPIDTATWEMLNDVLLSARPDIAIRVWGFYSSECDLSFLKYLTNVRHFSADCLRGKNVETVAKLQKLQSLSIGIFSLENFDFLGLLPARGLQKLSLGATKSRKPALTHLARFSELQTLFIEGQGKDIEAISSLPDLEDLTLRSITVDDLNFLKSSRKLSSLDIKLGGTTNLAALEGMNAIKYLELWQIRGLTDISVISTMRGLQYLFLQSLPRVTALPDLSQLNGLRRVHLENMKGIRNVEGLAKAPALEEVMHCSAQGMKPSQYEDLLNRRTLKRIFVGFGSEQKNKDFTRRANEMGIAACKRSQFLFA